MINQHQKTNVASSSCHHYGIAAGPGPGTWRVALRDIAEKLLMAVNEEEVSTTVAHKCSKLTL